jgi:hypothetical protein
MGQPAPSEGAALAGTAAAIVIEPPVSWPLKRFHIDPKQLFRLRAMMKEKGQRSEAESLRLALHEGLKSLGY